MASIDAEFETVWGWKTCEVSEIWRKSNEARKLEAGQSQKRIIVRGTSIGRHLSEVRTLGPTSPTSSIVSVHDAGDADGPPQPSSSVPSGLPEDLHRRTLPSLKAIGLLDSLETGRTRAEVRSTPPPSQSREW